MRRAGPGLVTAIGVGLLCGVHLRAEPLPMRQTLPSRTDARCVALTPVVRQLLSDRSSARDRPAQVFVASDLVPSGSSQLTAYRLNDNGHRLNAQPVWGRHADGHPTGTGDLLDALPNPFMVDQRVVYTDDQGGRLWRWDRLGNGPGSPQDWLQGTDSAAQGQARLNHLRGDRRQERQQGGALNDRASRQGAIAQGGLWYSAPPSASHGLPGYRAFASQFQARPAMLYLGGSAGLLHGFDASTGQERLAYVPRGVFPKLRALTESPPGSAMPMTVDGPVFTGDANTGTSAQPDWRTLLIGSLGRGGKGYFVLDVSDPAGFAASDAVAAKVVRLDRTDGSDPDIGHLTGHPVRDTFRPHHSPQITRLNDGRWAVLLGNGPNSANEDPVLLIQYLDSGTPSLRKIPAASGDIGQAVGNGLATPRPVDLNGDGSADVVYAGDLQGQLWKFDLLSSNPADWGVAFSGPRCTLCTPLFQARNAQGQPQPITAAPTVGPEPGSAGLMVAFGTGRQLTESDDSDTAVQTVYAVLDRTRYRPHPDLPQTLRLDPGEPLPSPVTGGRSALRERRLSGNRLNHGTAEAGPGFWTMAEGQARVATTGTDAVQGWYLDLPEAGERVLQAPEFLDGSLVLQVRSRVPAALLPNASGCPTAEDRGFLTLLGLTQGLAPSLPLLDANADGRYQTQGDRGANRTGTRSAWWGLACHQGTCQVEGTAPETARTLAPLPKPPRILQWRQLQ